MAEGGWDIAEINRAGGGKVSWEDTRHKGPWKNYSQFKVPWGGFVYPAFELNQRYEKTDVFISLAKLKDHANAGVTMSVKNLFGIAPTSVYGDAVDGAGRAERRRAVDHTARRHVPQRSAEATSRRASGSRSGLATRMELPRAAHHGRPVRSTTT